MSGTDFSETAVEDWLKLSRGDIKLPSRTILALSTYYEDVVLATCGEDVQGLGVDAFLESCVDSGAVKGPLPAPIKASYSTWFASEPTAEPVLLKKTSPHVHGKSLKEIGKLSIGLPGNGATDADNDTAAMGLTPSEITSLSLSIETGQVHHESETIDIAYGSDPRLTEIARQRRKTGLESLSKLIDAKDARGIMVHFSSLIRDLNVEGRAIQVGVVTAWLMENQQVYSADDNGLVNYTKEYLRRYRGRAFPVKFDTALFAKSLMSGGRGGLSEAQKEEIKEAKACCAKVATLKAQVETLKDQFNTLKSEVRRIKDKGEPSAFGRQAGKFECDFCGKPGHIAARCKLNPESSAYDKKFAEKVNGKKDEDEE